MRYLICVYIIVLITFSCSTNNENKTKELELREKELELKERELIIKEKSLESKQISSKPEQTKERNKNKKELRYLFHANGGIKGYFDDGTIVGCPRCDFLRSNILNMFIAEPIGTYEVQPDGSLLINNSYKEFPKYEKDLGWALIDYKWNEKVPQN